MMMMGSDGDAVFNQVSSVELAENNEATEVHVKKGEEQLSIHDGPSFISPNGSFEHSNLHFGGKVEQMTVGQGDNQVAKDLTTLSMADVQADSRTVDKTLHLECETTENEIIA